MLHHVTNSSNTINQITEQSHSNKTIHEEYSIEKWMPTVSNQAPRIQFPQHLSTGLWEPSTHRTTPVSVRVSMRMEVDIDTDVLHEIVEPWTVMTQPSNHWLDGMSNSCTTNTIPCWSSGVAHSTDLMALDETNAPYYHYDIEDISTDSCKPVSSNNWWLNGNCGSKNRLMNTNTRSESYSSHQCQHSTTDFDSTNVATNGTYDWTTGMSESTYWYNGLDAPPDWRIHTQNHVIDNRTSSHADGNPMRNGIPITGVWKETYHDTNQPTFEDSTGCIYTSIVTREGNCSRQTNPLDLLLEDETQVVSDEHLIPNHPLPLELFQNDNSKINMANKQGKNSQKCHFKTTHPTIPTYPRYPNVTNVCRVCSRVYARPSTLKMHLLTHSGFRPYQCTRCMKKFSQAANLTAHMRTHSGERPFQCPVCSRCFSQSSSVTTHLRTHSGERPYTCRLCLKSFADSSTLTKHFRVHSGEKPYKCSQCAVSFSQSGNLKRHSRLHLDKSLGSAHL